MDDKTRREIDRYSEEMPDISTRLGFFDALWELQGDVSGKAAEWSPPARDTMFEALVTGQPVFTVDAPSIPLDVYRDTVSRIALLVAEADDMDEETASFLADVDLAEAVDEQMLQGALSDVDAFAESVASGVGASESSTLKAVDFVLTAALTPFLDAAALAAVEDLEDIDWTMWGSGECPVCGTPANVGRIVAAGELEGDERLLSCPLCLTEWKFERLRCARCGTRDHTKLRYLFEEGDPGHRVHVCETCHGYLKVSDERELGHPTVPPVEDVVTLIMDAVAIDRGYSRVGSSDADSSV